MRFLNEHRRRPALLADHLPWAALVAPGIILNKDGSFTSGLSFRGPDLDSSSEAELMAVRSRLNNALRRLGAGWCLHVEARRRLADPYPEPSFDHPVPWIVDAERRAAFEDEDPAFETECRLALTWLAPEDRSRRVQGWLFERSASPGRDWRETLERYRRDVDALFDLLSDALPHVSRLDEVSLLTWLHECVSTRSHQVVPPEIPMFLDAWLADDALTGGVAPRLGDRPLRVVSVRSLPSTTRPCLLDALGELPFACRWSVRWLALGKAEAEAELVRLRRRWFAKRKGVGTLLREAITREETPLVDTDALARTQACDAAIEALGSDACAYGFMTLTVSLTAASEAEADERARAVEAVLNAHGLVARVEDLNAVEAWLGSIPGEPYADVRRPMVSTLNLADLLPVSAAWSGPAQDPRLKGPPLVTARTSGGAPFRLCLHVGDVGHTMVVGPTGAGKSVLLSFLALQWLRYPEARVVFLDKGRSARAATLAVEGRWRAMEAGGEVSLQPLARIDDPAERSWAAEWLAACVEAAGVDVDPPAREAIWSALGALAKAPVTQRTLTVFRALLQDHRLSLALEPLTLQGAHGALLDGADGAQTAARFDCYELEALMGSSSVVAPVLGALFHEIELSLDGRPTLLVLDEAWLFLDSGPFAARIREWLKTLRKKGAAVIFATQSLDDVVSSSIASALIENCPSQIFLPNPRALEPASAELYGRFGLSPRQRELIAFASPKRAYYLRQPTGRRLFDLRLTGAGLALCAASAPEDQALIDRICRERPPHEFARAFLEAKELAHVEAALAAFRPR